MSTKQKLVTGMLLTAACATMSVAQTNDTVSLQAKDGSMTLTGVLLEAPSGQYRISTAMGIMEIGAEKVECVGVSCPTLSLTFDPDAEITLRSLDGATNIIGQIKAIVDGNYQIEVDGLGLM